MSYRVSRTGEYSAAPRLTTITRAFISLAIFVSYLLQSCVQAQATNFILSEFAELNKERAKEVFPNLAESFPGARFLMASFTTSTGEWHLFRVESGSACVSDLCPTIVVHRGIDWKVMVHAQRDIAVSINYENGESVQCDLKSNDGRIVSLRYIRGERIITVQ